MRFKKIENSFFKAEKISLIKEVKYFARSFNASFRIYSCLCLMSYKINGLISLRDRGGRYKVDRSASCG